MCLLPVFYVGGVFSKSFCRPRDVGFHHRLYFLRLQKMMFKKHKYVTLANMPVMISLAKYISVYFDLVYVAYMPISWYIKVFILTCHMLHICLYHDILKYSFWPGICCIYSYIMIYFPKYLFWPGICCIYAYIMIY